MNGVETKKQHPGHLHTYREWAIVKTGDGVICLDPNGLHCLPGGVTHDNIQSAKKSIDHFLLAQGDVNLFWLLSGRSGWDLYADRNSTHQANGWIQQVIAKRDNDQYEPTYEYRHVVNFNPDNGLLKIEANGLNSLTPESALALSNLLRDAAVNALEKGR